MAVNGIVACNDYDTHEADSVPRFGGRRASGEVQRGPPRQKGRGHEEHEGRNEADYNFLPRLLAPAHSAHSLPLFPL